MMMTIDKFRRIKPGEVFEQGVIENTPDGIYMTDGGGTLKYVAVKGGFDDWALYVHWAYHSWEYVRNCGDKVISEHHIRRVVDCSNEVYIKYRF